MVTQMLCNWLQINYFIIYDFQRCRLYNHVTWQSSFQKLILQLHLYIQNIHRVISCTIIDCIIMLDSKIILKQDVHPQEAGQMSYVMSIKLLCMKYEWEMCLCTDVNWPLWYTDIKYIKYIWYKKQSTEYC